MKQEQVIELARKHATCTSSGFHEFSSDELAALIAEVEQATLERAAQICDKVDERIEGSAGTQACAREIRNLAKDTQ